MDDDLKAELAELERLAKDALEPVLVGAEKAAHMRQREYRFAANPSTVLRLISALRQRDEALEPFGHYYRLNDLRERADDDAIEVPVRDLRRAAILTGSETNAR